MTLGLHLLAMTSVVASVILVTPLARATGPFDGHPKILLHLASAPGSHSCTNVPADCAAAVNAGVVSTPENPHYYYAYLVAARGEYHPETVAGIQLGLQYDNGCPGGDDNLDRVDIFSWTLCASLQFSTPGGAWYEPGGGTLITWASQTACQAGPVAVAGYFYLACYGAPDVLEIVPRPIDLTAKIADCSSSEIVLDHSDLGSVAFTATGATSGCNPCDGPCPDPLTRVCGPDLVPPAAVGDLTVTGFTASSVTLEWTAVGDDGTGGGPADFYDIRRSIVPITEANFASATLVGGEPIPGVPGAHESFTVTGLAPGTRYYFAMKVHDQTPYPSPLSNVATRVTAPPDGDNGPPAPTTDLAVVSETVTGILVQWTSAGDDSLTGTAAGYDIRASLAPITEGNFATAILLTGEPAPGPALSLQQYNITAVDPGPAYYIAMRTYDEHGLQSDLSNVVSGAIPVTGAEENENASLVLHVTPTTATTCGAGNLEDCHNATPTGALGDYHVYLLIGQFGQVAGVECGLTYGNGNPAGLDDHVGVDIDAWTLCGTLQFPTASPAWPAPGSGNAITWTTAVCQVPPTAVVGWFDVTAYSPDDLRLTVRPVSGQAAVATCNAALTILPSGALGSARFSAAGNEVGYNPCNRNSVNVRPTTWSRIKTLIGG
jgi:hypothetical protein